MMAYEISSASGEEPKTTNQSPPIPLSTQCSQPLLRLPADSFVEILSRLPVKCLLRLRCVCKSWRSMIFHPTFTKTHLRRASIHIDYTNRGLIFSSNLYPRSNNIKSCSLYSILNEKSGNAVQLDSPLKDPDIQVTIWGCYDGLICIGTDRSAYIWNPTTRKYKEFWNDEMGCHCSPWFAFGYDEFIEDYKVVGLFSDNRSSDSNLEVKVYTLRSDSWRRIEEACPPGSLGKFVNRAFHWFSSSASSDSENVIVSLDLVKETYGEISKPEYGDSNFKAISLGVLDECLCILFECPSTCFHVWVMKDYGIRDSWTKLFVIRYGPSPPYSPHSSLLCILENGEVLLSLAAHLVRYKPKEQVFRFPEIHDCPRIFGACSYIESLVSPHAIADQ